MIPELWLVISTFCITPTTKLPMETFWISSNTSWVNLMEYNDCVRLVEMKNEKLVDAGFAYRVIPATATACDVWGHEWNWLTFEYRGCTGMICERCRKCRKKKEVMKKDWEWED